MNKFDTDQLNIGFIIIALVFAILLPFELFLFSYAVLGPIHYLTEINWLKSKTYFSNTFKTAYILFGIVGLIFIIYLGNLLDISLLGINVSKFATFATTNLILSSFIFVILLEFFEKKLGLTLCLVLSIIFSLLLIKAHNSFHIFSFLFLPTLIHVYLFTGLFMLYGYTKQKKRLTLFGIGLLIAVPIIIYFLPISFFQPIGISTAKDTYNNSGFAMLNSFLVKLFKSNSNVASINIKVQCFIAFAYTYHYLNWFGKTNVIGWAKAINKKILVIILCVWLIVIGIYIYDYAIGLLLLFFMSLAHVLVEFPLNIKSIKSLFYFTK